MDGVDLDDATAELYALTPTDFTARRTALAAEAKAAGDAALARTIGRLRRPTVAAWLVNQLARGAAGSTDDVEELEQLGTQLREAQSQLDGPRMKALTRRRHEVVAALVRAAETIADDDGAKVSPAVRREVEETFGAAVADEQASLAVTSGRLTRALAYAGLGEVDLTEATATPASAASVSTRRPPAAGHRSTDRAERRAAAKAAATRADTGADARAQAEKTLAQARADEAAARDDLDEVSRRRDTLEAEESRLSELLDELQQRIVRTRHELDGITRSLTGADRDAGRRRRQLDQAGQAVRRAERELERRPPA